MQVIKCTPWNTRLYPHPTIIKKMKTFLEVEGKMGPIPQPTSSQYKPLNQIQILRSGKTMMQKRGREQHQQKGSGPVQSPSLLRQLYNHPQPFPKLQKTQKSDPPPLEKAPVYESTPWPGAGRMSGNLFEDRNWLLPPNYLNNDHKKAASSKSTIKEEPKTGMLCNPKFVYKNNWYFDLSSIYFLYPLTLFTKDGKTGNACFH